MKFDDFHKELINLLNEYHLYPILFQFFRSCSGVDVERAMRLEADRGIWTFSDKETLQNEGVGDVTFPYGPIHVVSTASVSESDSCGLQWRFQLNSKPTNTSACCSVIPEQHIDDRRYFGKGAATLGSYLSGPTFGVQSGGGGTFHMKDANWTKVVTVTADPQLRLASFHYFDRCGVEITDSFPLTSDMFPLRLGLCGFNQTQICFLPCD